MDLDAVVVVEDAIAAAAVVIATVGVVDVFTATIVNGMSVSSLNSVGLSLLLLSMWVGT